MFTTLDELAVQKNPNPRDKSCLDYFARQPTMSTEQHHISSWDFHCKLQVEYPSEEKASIVHTALSVDSELQPDKVKRSMALSGRQLVVSFSAVEARFLRASFSAFIDILALATKTIEEFGTADIVLK